MLFSFAWFISYPCVNRVEARQMNRKSLLPEEPLLVINIKVTKVFSVGADDDYCGLWPIKYHHGLAVLLSL